MEKQKLQKNANVLPKNLKPMASQRLGLDSAGKKTGTLYPEQIPEAQGDLADRATIEIDQELQENIMRARTSVDPSRQHYKKNH